MKTQLEILLIQRRKGLITKTDFFCRLTELMMSTEVDSTLSQLSRDIAEEYWKWLSEFPPSGRGIIQGVVPRDSYDPDEIDRKIRRAVPLVDNWFKKKA